MRACGAKIMKVSVFPQTQKLFQEKKQLDMEYQQQQNSFHNTVYAEK